MRRTFRATHVLVLAACLTLSQVSPAPAQPSLEETEQAIKDATRRLLRALEGLMMSIPQYEAPEVLENGDIIIRRKRPGPSDKGAPAEPDMDETAT